LGLGEVSLNGSPLRGAGCNAVLVAIPAPLGVSLGQHGGTPLRDSIPHLQTLIVRKGGIDCSGVKALACGPEELEI